MWSHAKKDQEIMAWLLQPVTIEQFEKSYYERAPLHVSRNVPGYYQEYFSLAELERTLYTAELTAGDLQAFKDGTPARPESYVRKSLRADKAHGQSRPTEVIDADRVSALFAYGCSLVLDRVPAYSTTVARLAREMECFFGHHVNANMYMTPPGNQGFAVHYDTHDTVIMQIEGSKHWRVYNAAMELPYKDQFFDKKKGKVGELSIETEMQPGDLLYIPRGVLHEGRANDQMSLHLTFGLYPVLWHDLLREALMAQMKAGEPFLRRSIGTSRPPDFASQELLGALQRVFSPENLARASETITRAFVSERLNDLEGQIRQINLLPSLSQDSEISIRADMLYHLTDDETGTQLLFSGKTVRLSASAAPIVREIAAAGRVPVSALNKHDEKAIDVVRKLIQEGFAVQCDPVARGAKEVA